MRWYHILLLAVLQIAGLLVFCLGFFPSKVVLKGFGEFDNGNYDPQFNKIVFMVVDALRSDFIFSEDSSMLYVQSLLREGSALGFTAYSNPPTVTLPRLKGITTGSTPNFLDAVLNVVEEDSSSTLANQDSWITQLKKADKRIHMYGDDTWIKLFPSVFDEVDGTGSFFVSDFTEVDNNVTRHLDHELSEQSWDCLILHYLGLDHIGHKGGPKSIFMSPKQREMDSIVEKIHSKLDDDTLMVLLGDHGMNDIGNHGGSSAGETSAGLVFISNKLRKLNSNAKVPLPKNEDFKFLTKVQQIDLVPTISNLLRLPIPRNNLGIMIKEFLPLWSADQQLNLMKENLKNYENLKGEVTNLEDINMIYDFLINSQSGLTQSATNYLTDKMLCGIVMLIFSSLFVLLYLYNTVQLYSIWFYSLNILYGITMFGSSFVEEEYQIWWWFATFFIVFLCYGRPSNLLYILFLIRLVRGWNNTGQKYIGDTIFQYLQEHPFINWLLVFLTISVYGFSLNNGAFSLFSPLLSFLISFLLSITCFTFKLLFSLANGDEIPKELVGLAAFTMESLGVDNAQDSLIDLARMFYYMVLAVLVLRLGLKFKSYDYWFFTDLHNLLSFVLIFQTSLQNIPLFLVFLGIKHQVGLVSGNSMGLKKSNRISFVSLFCLILQHLSFFSLGQSNSLATVDLSNAYNGISGYNILAVGVLTFISNFSTPIFWSFGSLSILFENKEKLAPIKYEVLKTRWLVSTSFYTIGTTFTLIACYALRYHLFIWTVFSPKLLYTLAWNLLMNGLVEILCLLLTILH
ncbi:GPI ethanolamine phosphate transferase 2 [Wickerhamomyces ciferrii]|uniref:GPI ethanolamine phosphate transferase 2 n=1 Tax=Wickerhamomyces ciferrii (strain ATCC 14091 / BCRC 22168 / CBS 111 / JCM 3599 / NBRC 0793 / NRRL Y-1031 F-60-10) TaxID=1206466 RepID=K0KIQ2_WICCF|nr:GPI ethanolamine phosphate transferase 2 [Wickerhamomyces ciferrii]CCH42057.1 GPI ethanolamine phosphate transferase 2 [Wickerhamomyces ciferrii]